jgi:hypothetical protein
MMANPEMSSTQEQGLAAVPPQGRPADAAEAPEKTEAPEALAAPAPPRRRPAPAYEPEPERMPLMARVLLADLAVAVVALIVLFVIEVQRFGDASLTLRRRAWGEDLFVLFGVAVVFGVVACLLAKARHTRVVVVQAIVTALVLAAAVTSAATGNPKPSPDSPVTGTTGQPGNPG